MLKPSPAPNVSRRTAGRGSSGLAATVCALIAGAMIGVGFHASPAAAGEPHAASSSEHTLAAGAVSAGGSLGARALAETPPWVPTPAMVRWAQARVPTHGEASERLAALRLALLAPDVLGLEARDVLTADAATAFARRRADCVSFAYLLLGLGRALDLDVELVALPGRGRPARRSMASLRFDHVAVAVRDATGRGWIVDVESIRPRGPRAETLDDAIAAALIDANRGARLLAAGRCRDAAPWLWQAAQQAPHHRPMLDHLQALWRCRERSDPGAVPAGPTLANARR
ncbi:MAG: hypothetical protein AAGN46_08830 [Acidobacteriota bacterium]